MRKAKIQMMRVWAKVLLVLLALGELAVAALYVWGMADPWVPGVLDNPHSLHRVIANHFLVGVMLPVVLVIVVGALVAMVIGVWRLARQVGQRFAG